MTRCSRSLLRDHGYRHTDYYAGPRSPARARRTRARRGLLGLGAADSLTIPGRALRPARATVASIASSPGCSGSTWRRATGELSSSSCRTPTRPILDRVEAALHGSRSSRVPGAGSDHVFFDVRLGASSGGSAPAAKAAEKRVAVVRLRMAQPLIAAFLDGLVDGDGSVDDGPYLGLDDLRRSRRRPPRPVRLVSACARVRHGGRPWPYSDLPGLPADTRAQAPDRGAAARPTPRCCPCPIRDWIS